MVFSVIGDSDSFAPRPWPKTVFQTALIEAAKSGGGMLEQQQLLHVYVDIIWNTFFQNTEQIIKSFLLWLVYRIYINENMYMHEFFYVNATHAYDVIKWSSVATYLLQL